MAALTASRNTLQWGDTIKLDGGPVKSNTKIYGGSLVVSDAGYFAPGRAATGLVAVGVAVKDFDNLTATDAQRRDSNATVMVGVFKFGNSTSGDLIAQSDKGASCYIVDDQTVAKTDGSSARSVAGPIIGVDADGGVWVLVGQLAP